ncbi:hypothetical protein HYW21_02455 [Candidatus Woesearchaeota archaeon]|nr:hypothetical protein [Candidatus Woesearchaeota archaeon]
MKKLYIVSLVLVLMVGSLIFFAARNTTGSAVRSTSAARGDTFVGRISNVAVQAGTLSGMGVYDRSCKMGTDGLTSCDAGIETKEYGLLNFKYRHDMTRQPCLAPNDLVEVRILDAQGNAEIQRL